jgi:hypothetical protein
VARFFETRRARIVVWLLYALGSGLGWLAVPLGGFTADLWVAEAIPFLTVFSNAHFGLATALLLALLLWTVPGLADSRPTVWRLAIVAVATTLLAQVLPMALLNVGLVLSGVFAWWVVTARPARWPSLVRDWLPAFVFGLAAAPWLVQAALITMRHPTLALWNAQNQTPSPPVWDAAIAGGVLLLLAIPGAVVAARRRTPRDVIVLLWLGLGTLALYAPFSLQRRLSIGLWMPLTLLAGLGLRRVVWPRVGPRLRPLVGAGLAVALVTSNLLVVAATLGAVAARQPDIFMTRAQAMALDWLRANAGRGLVAAPPAQALWVPARTDARVIYGHPFETVQADERKAEVEAFFAGDVPGPAFVAEQRVAYILAQSSGDARWVAPADWVWRVVFEQDGVVIYAP